MGLITTVFILAVVIIVILVAAKLVIPSGHQQVTTAEAVSNVTNYIMTSYPGAVVNITGVNSSQAAGSWNILASVVTNSTSPCPSYFVLSFDYPQYQFVARVQNNYTAYVNESGVWICKIDGWQPGSQYQIPSPEVAEALSYNLTINQTRAFVGRYGYGNVEVHAGYFSSAVIDGVNYTDVYLVNYTSPGANHSVSVVLYQNSALNKRFIAAVFNTSG